MTMTYTLTKILLVEDALQLAQVICRELEASNYEVFYAANGLIALDLFAQRKPDLIILDWMLPGLDGLEVLRQIRKNSFVPVLMLTAREMEMDRVIGLEVGADDYLTKPFSMRELLARIYALLRRAQHTRSVIEADRSTPVGQLCYENLTINAQTFEVSLTGAALELTRIEFGLLQLFIANPGVAFNRAYLLDSIWGQNFVSGDRSVDSAVARLRKKLGNLGEAIEPVWGIGYRLRKLS